MLRVLEEPISVREKRLEYHFFEYPETVVLYYVLNGQVSIKNYRGKYDYYQGQYFVANVLEPIMFEGWSEDHKLLEIRFTQSKVMDLYRRGKFFEIICQANSSNWAEREHEFSQDIEEFYKEYKQGFCFEEVLLRRLISFYDVTNYDHLGKKLSKKVKERHLEIVNYIKDQRVREVTLSSVADKVNSSVYHISHDIKDRVGLTFQEMRYLIATRRAINELVLSEASITNISHQSGFSDPKYFVKYMKKFYGYTPSEFRRLYHLHQQKKIFMSHEVIV